MYIAAHLGFRPFWLNLNPKSTRVQPSPYETELTQWYFQRYTQHLPSAGEIVLFD
ncbi:MAG TPA: hypothetical protein EYH36_04890 [Desulfocapsa sulfexigens]|nr:hypothetical protein [Desulfocapsa sulfexigens]HIQ37318.1 hypothetical protein [Desulfocapsa sulfexigens]